MNGSPTTAMLLLPGHAACVTLGPPVLFILFNKVIYLFLAALGLHCCTQPFSSCGERGLLFVWCSGFSCCRARALGAWSSVVVAGGL